MTLKSKEIDPASPPQPSGFFKSSWIFIITVLSTLKTCLHILIVRGEDNPGFRAKIDKILRHWAERLLGIISVQMSVVGEENIHLEAGRAHMIMCSHTSNYDIPATFAVMPGSIRMLAKKELKKIPIFGHAIARSEMPFVDRINRKQAIKDLAYAKAKMESGIILWVAPEGTRTHGEKKVGKLKKGGFHLALATDAIIIPIAFRGIHDVQLLRQIKWNLNKEVVCHIGKPIDSRDYDKKHIKQFMTDFESKLSQLVGVEDVSQTVSTDSSD